jgi:endonuclease/exonuclease/phosphatase family metal-dependent hydrolase
MRPPLTPDRPRALLWLLAALLAGAGAACRPPPAVLTASPRPPTEPAPTTPPVPTPTPTRPPAPSATRTARPSATPAALASDPDFLDRPGADSLRVMSYNVNWDSIFPALDAENHDLRSASRVTAFRRIMAAVRPDIVCLQEINPERDPGQVSAILEETLAAHGAAGWHAAGARDTVIAARFPVQTDGLTLEVPPFPRELPQAAALVDLPDDVYGARDVYFICAHFKAGGNFYDIVLRQRQADVIARQLGDAQAPGGSLDLPAGTPLIVLGDFNIYDSDPAEHLDTLLTGDIENEDQYGPDVQPDWDGTALADAAPSHNGLGQEFYTWRADDSPLNPGTLDRILYSDSALALENAFILNTTLLSDPALAAAGLRADDVVLDPSSGYFDHLPLVVDFRLLP